MVPLSAMVTPKVSYEWVLPSFLAFVGTTAVSTPSRADAPSADHVVQIIVPTSENEDAAIQSIVETAQSHLADLNVAVVRDTDDNPFPTAEDREHAAARRLEDPAVLAVMWCIPEAKRYRVFIYLADSREDDSPSMRGIEVAGAEGTGETLGIILRASVSALLEKAEPKKAATLPPEAATPPKPTPPPEQSPPPPAVEPPPQRPEKENLLFLEAAYEVGFPILQWDPIHGAYFAVGLRIFEYVRIHLSYTVSGPYRIEDDTLFLEIRRHPVGIGVVFFLRQGFVEPRFRFSALIDYASTDLTLKDKALSSKAPDGQMQVSLQPRVELGIRLYKTVQVFVGLGIDAFVLRPKYTVHLIEGPKTVFEPLSVQALATVGLSASFF